MITDIARELGFVRAAIIPIEAPRRLALYKSWLDDGLAGGMTYLAEPMHIETRADIRTLLETAKSLVVVALAYGREDPIPPAALLRGRIARYARGEDYHIVMRDKLVVLADRISQELGRPVAIRTCVDSAPVLEREWAERAGLGFVAKNTMLIAPGVGSYVVLGEMLLDVELPPTAPAELPKPRCGSCTRCLDACPTGAFVDAYTLDARRCISYLTIEHHGSIPVELRLLIGTWVFGCDVCQEVCPFNAGAGEAPEPMLTPRTVEHALPDLIALATMPSNQLRHFMKRSAMRRIPRQVMLRNVAIALGNTGSRDAIPALEKLLSHSHELVREHAAWAIDHLTKPGDAT